jgi:uncharacterized alkaline shock family protein YloU
MTNTDPLVMHSEKGKIRISEDIIMTIARNAVDEIEGITEISGGFPGGIARLFSRNATAKSGVLLEKEEDHLILNLSLEVLYGAPIPQLVEQAQEKVKLAVETMTEISVQQVNIFVHNLKTT